MTIKFKLEAYANPMCSFTTMSIILSFQIVWVMLYVYDVKHFQGLKVNKLKAI